MTSRHLIDSDLVPLLDQLPTFAFSAEMMPMIRDGLKSHAARFPDPPIAPVEFEIEGPDGKLLVLWFDPSPGSSMRPAILHIHGGGMVLGSVHEMMHGPSLLAMKLQVPVATVEYRLAPETPFPGPQEDCYRALAWLAGAAGDLGIDPARVAVAGESAGGGLAAAVVQMARDRGGPKIAAQILTYPMLDHRVGGLKDPWCNRFTGEYVWTRENNQFAWEALHGSY